MAMGARTPRRWILTIALSAGTLVALLSVGRAYVKPSAARVEEDARKCFGTCRLDKVWRSRGDFPTIYMCATAWCGPADLPVLHEWGYRWEVSGWKTVHGACP
jgi:hypothetical protein